MTDTCLGRLARLVPPPATIDGGAVDWRQVETELGRLPSDYKKLIETYGAGSFACFLSVFHPQSELDLSDENRKELDALRYVEIPTPYAIDVGREEIMAWGRTENGDVCYWVKQDADPDNWTVTVNPTRSPDWFPFEDSMTRFILAVLTGEHTDDAFDDDVWMRDRFEFVPESDDSYYTQSQ